MTPQEQEDKDDLRKLEAALRTKGGHGMVAQFWDVVNEAFCHHNYNGSEKRAEELLKASGKYLVLVKMSVHRDLLIQPVDCCDAHVIDPRPTSGVRSHVTRKTS